MVCLKQMGPSSHLHWLQCRCLGMLRDSVRHSGGEASQVCNPHTSWSLGSALFLASWAAMMGPWQYALHLFSTPRLPFTGAYFGSIALTLYFSLGLHSTLLTLLSSVIQLTCLVWYLVSYFPMGSSGLRLATSFGASRAAAWMTG